uniref:Cytochrome P450 77A3-like n=1 Tax=Cucumis melo TaxID=3656 RepID=A0A9I9E9K4_CUCME
MTATTGESKLVVELINRWWRELESDGNATLFSYLDTLFDFKIDGRNATETVIEWGMAELIVNEEVQRKIVEEIKE